MEWPPRAGTLIVVEAEYRSFTNKDLESYWVNNSGGKAYVFLVIALVGVHNSGSHLNINDIAQLTTTKGTLWCCRFHPFILVRDRSC